jgi:hypothetical protein
MSDGCVGPLKFGPGNQMIAHLPCRDEVVVSADGRRFVSPHQIEVVKLLKMTCLWVAG